VACIFLKYIVSFARRIIHVWCLYSRFCFMCLRIKNMLFQFTFSFLERGRKYVVTIENMLCIVKEEFHIGLSLMFCLVYLAIDNTWFEFTFSLLKLKGKKKYTILRILLLCLCFNSLIYLYHIDDLNNYYFLHFALFRFESHTIKNKWDHKASQHILS